jgi:hypothetical protein
MKHPLAHFRILSVWVGGTGVCLVRIWGEDDVEKFGSHYWWVCLN